MASLGETLARLRSLNTLPLPFASGAGRLTRLRSFGANPGVLAGWHYLPPGLTPGAPLVVVLHGCRQHASGFDRAAGWSALADECGFALLYPEQNAGNNLFRCFNWFEPQDVAAEGGELHSIRAMIAAMVRRHRIDERRIFITGLSAGGAMTAAAIARFPDLFAGGAIIAGIPFGVAASPADAFARMAGQGLPDPATLAAALAAAAPGAKAYPALSIWQGEADDVVAPANADALEAQFRKALAVGAQPDETKTIGTATRRVWRDGSGAVRLESYRIPGMDHGAPIAPSLGCGETAPYMIDAGLCSTRRIAHFWGIAALEPAAPERKGRPRQSLLRRFSDAVFSRFWPRG